LEDVKNKICKAESSNNFIAKRFFFEFEERFDDDGARNSGDNVEEGTSRGTEGATGVHDFLGEN